jgi:hypothetical protein
LLSYNAIPLKTKYLLSGESRRFSTRGIDVALIDDKNCGKCK